MMTLIQKEKPMTVVVAVREDENSYLLAADGEASEGPTLRIPFEHKLFRHPTGLVAWGVSGNRTVGAQDLSEWLKHHSWPPKTWRLMRDETNRHLSRLNGAQRNTIRLAGLEPKPGDFAECLMVGWLDSRAEIIEFDSGGKASSYMSQGFHSIGTGKSHAWVAYKALSVVENLAVIDKLHGIMMTVLSTAPGCGVLYRIWRITPSNISEEAVVDVRFNNRTAAQSETNGDEP